MIVAQMGDRTLARVSPPRGSMPPAKRQVRTIDRLRAVRERALRMSATGPPPSPSASPEPASVELATERTAARNPWLWATAASAPTTQAQIQAQATKEETQQAADRVTALAPTCKDSVASAGG
jgi:hypothetical protein